MTAPDAIRLIARGTASTPPSEADGLREPLVETHFFGKPVCIETSPGAARTSVPIAFRLTMVMKIKTLPTAASFTSRVRATCGVIVP